MKRTSSLLRSWWWNLVNLVLVHMSRAGVFLVLATLACSHAWGQEDAREFDREFVHESVESVAAIVDREYFDAEIAAQVASSLRKRLAEGGYEEVKSLKSLADKLTQDLFEATQDKHLAVTMVEDGSLRSTSEVPDVSREIHARRTNFGVQRVEILAGNVGYFKLTSFYRPDEARDAISAAMRMLRCADALIIDLRENSGGSPDTVALLASYLFDAPDLPLFDIVPRSGDGVRHYKTLKPGPPDRDGTRPVYMLTAKQTFSAGEGFAFLLQQARRAEVVGEQTAGAANPGRPYPVNTQLEVTVPNGQVRTAVTRQNWEGKGVIPDVPVPASDALRTAHIRALREVLKQNPDGLWQETLKQHLDTLEISGQK
ncbi:MAG: S41 family peptidase [Pirellula sp.]